MFDAKKFPDLLAGFFISLVTLLLAFPFDNISGTILGHLLGVMGTILMFSA